MSAIAETARVSILLCDFAMVDRANKVNMLGAGWQITGLDRSTGSTAPHSVVVMVDVAPEHFGDSFAFELSLHDASGDVVNIVEPTGQVSPLRIGNNLVANRPLFEGQSVPKDALWSHSQVVMNFPGGLALAAGSAYTWRVRIDNDPSREWAISFFIAGPPAPVVVG